MSNSAKELYIFLYLTLALGAGTVYSIYIYACHSVMSTLESKLAKWAFSFVAAVLGIGVAGIVPLASVLWLSIFDFLGVY